MKKITLKFLKKLHACNDAIESFQKHKPGTNPIAVIDKAMELGRFDWSNWLIVRLMNKRQKVEYSVFAAGLVLHYYEAKFPGNDAPREAIEAAKAYLKKPSKKTKAAAYAAAAAAYAAYAAAAAAAAYAAAAAAAYAAYADAAAAAAYAAADAAAYAAADADEIKKKIIEYGKTLIL